MKNYLLHFFLFAGSYIIPKKKNLIVCGGGDAKQFQGNPKYLLLFLVRKKCDTLSYYWSAKSPAQQKALAEKNIPFIDPYTWKGFFTILRAKYLVIEKSSYDVYYTKNIFGRFNFIQTWHATPSKKVGIHAQDWRKSGKTSPALLKILYRFLKQVKFFSRQKYKLIISPSEAVSAIFEEAFENKNVRITGYPRNDILFDSNLSVHNYADRYRFNRYSKVILYAPTFRDNKSIVSPLPHNIQKFNDKLKAHNYLLIVKKHPWEKKLVIPPELSNITDVSNQVDDVQELLAGIDLLITDYSSVFYDFMLTGRHTIFYSYDLEEYLQECRGLYFDYYKELQGPFATNQKELSDLIFSLEEWSTQKDYREKYKRVLDKYNKFKDGHSSERLLEILFPGYR